MVFVDHVITILLLRIGNYSGLLPVAQFSGQSLRCFRVQYQARPPLTVPNGNRNVYLRHPDGITIEFQITATK